jgi:2-polyprenyl-3-methyl-5-hydroxy-6-metoxy-1,4-benzoquinol methylase
MDEKTLAAYDTAAAAFADDWNAQSAPGDMYRLLRQYFKLGRTADIGCGAGRDVAWLAANGFDTHGYDASEGLLREARIRYPALCFDVASLPELANIGPETFENVLCETVVMHLSLHAIGPATRRLLDILKPAARYI